MASSGIEIGAGFWKYRTRVFVDPWAKKRARTMPTICISCFPIDQMDNHCLFLSLSLDEKRKKGSANGTQLHEVI